MGDYTTGETPHASDSQAEQVPSVPRGNVNGSASSNSASSNSTSSTNGDSSAYPPALQPMSERRPMQGSAGDPPVDGLMQILGRQWHVVILTTLVALILGVGYLLVTPPTYTAISTMTVEPLDPTAIGGTSTAQNDPSDFLETQCVVIRSSAVLALAVDKIRESDRVNDTHTLKNVDRPLEYLKQYIDANLSKVGKAIDVTFDSRSQASAIAVVSAVVDSYREYNSNNWSDRAKSYLSLLEQGQDAKQRQMADIQARMLEIARKVGHAPNIDPGKDPAHMLVESLRDAKMKAMLDSIDATNAYKEAGNAIIGHPDLVRQYDDQERRATGASADPQAQLKTLQDELLLEQAKLEDAQRQYLPAHPIVKTIQRRIDQLTVSAVIAAKEWQQAAQARQEALDLSLHDAEQSEMDLLASEQEYAKLQAQLNGMNESDDDVRKKIRDIDLSKGEGALNISVLNPAEIDSQPKPSARKTLGIAVVLGLITGLGVACLRDWTDDRLRNQHAVRAVVGAPILGAIPAITSAHTASDRGQIVHHDPFGDAAESYRTLRTALQFGLPSGTKTLLITSPVSGDGKSTLISNLGISLTQAGKKVLIVDADFRAPMQHRLFDLKDEIGFATVIGGPDSIDQAIQHTDIERLDVLPCGPIPSNPAEMLNDPLFLEYLNDLADRYDLILIDSPPVTAVTDARIIAASVDASLLVVRPMTSTRKQTEAARDGLRGVGARLIGVAVNAVPRGGDFGGPSGYYPRSITPPARSGRRGQSVSDDDRI
jgi:succinoglycan biosynthesis transport protein ExoP